MPKTRVKTTPAEARLVKAERTARREKEQLRRLHRAHRAIVDLSRRVTRAVQAADTARVVAARALLEGTDYTPVFVPQLEQDARDLDDARNTLAAAATEHAQLKAELDSWRLKAGGLELYIAELKTAAGLTD